MIPKGTLLIIGGGEDKGVDDAPDIEFESHDFTQFEILEKFISGKDHIEIITTGSDVKADVKKKYQKTFKKIGFKNPGFMELWFFGKRITVYGDRFFNNL